MTATHHSRTPLSEVVRAAERVLARVEIGDCWLVPGTPENYAKVRLGSSKDKAPGMAAHKAVYETLVGPVPDGKVLDHLCRVRRCVNPDHLEPVTNGENVLRGFSLAAIAARRTHCRHGHEYTSENTWRDKTGSRHCLTCARERMRARRAQ